MIQEKPSGFQRFVVHKHEAFQSTSEYRRAILTGIFPLILLVICGIYALIDNFYIKIQTPYIYISVAVISVFIFWVNKNGYHTLAKIGLLFTSTVSIFLFSSSSLSDTGTYMFYFPILLLAFALFDFSRFYWSLFFAILNLILLIIDSNTEQLIFTNNLIPESFAEILRSVNYSIGFLATIVITVFLVQTDHITQSELMNNQERLKKLAENLKNSESRYELAMTGTNAGLWDWDLVNDHIHHGSKWKSILGYEESDQLDIPIHDFYKLVHPDDVEKVKTSLKDHFEKKSEYNLEYRVLRKDGEYEWIYDAGKAIWDEHHKPVRMVGSIINVSKRKLAEQKIKEQNELLEKTNAELDRFVYITSHDLRAPLLSIMGLINLAEISNDPSEIALILKMMRERVKGLENFISDIIDFSRNVRVGIVMEKFNLFETVQSIINEFIYIENANKVHFTINIDPGLNIITDHKRLVIILKNLISNAIKYQNYNQEKPFIEVSCIILTHILELKVKDNGEGIGEDQTNKIFDMFFRASEKSTGSGLGLYIVKEMTDKLGGVIQVKSEPGIGSEFIVRIPVTF